MTLETEVLLLFVDMFLVCFYFLQIGSASCVKQYGTINTVNRKAHHRIVVICPTDVVVHEIYYSDDQCIIPEKLR